MPAAPPPVTRNITLAEGMTVRDLADKLLALVAQHVSGGRTPIG